MTFRKYGFTVSKLGINTTGGLLQTSSIPTTVAADPPIQVSRWARNGKHPNALAESMKSNAGNAAAMFKTKEVFSSPGYLGYLASNGMTVGTGVVNRWRCAFRTGPITDLIDADVYAQGDSTYGTAASFGQLVLTEVATGIATTTMFPVGAQVSGAGILADTKLVTQRIDVKPGTDYNAVFSDHGTNMYQATIRELASLLGFNGGYLPANIASGGGILDGYRQNAAQLARDLWQKGAWTIFNWSIEDGTLPVSTSSSSFTNLLDSYVTSSGTTAGSATINSTSAGFSVDTTGRGRRSQLNNAGIPIVIACYGSCDVNASAYLYLYNSSGALVANQDEFMTTTPGWAYFTGFLPAGKNDKYDLRIATDPGTTSKFHAVSIYEFG